MKTRDFLLEFAASERLACRNASSWECDATQRFRRAVTEYGPDATLVHDARTPWVPIEGRSGVEIRRKHPDPLGALQRGEVPAIILRGAVPPADVQRMAVRLAHFAWSTPIRLAGISPYGEYAERGLCAALSLARCACPAVQYRRLHSSTASAFKQSCTGECGDDHNLTLLLREHNFSARAWACKLSMMKQGFLYYEWGKKMLNSFGGTGDRIRLFGRSRRVNEAIQRLAKRGGCKGHFCTPHAAMLHGIQQMAGTARNVTVGAETVRHWRGKSRQLAHVPGILRVLARNFSYQMHFDSHHANAWVGVRNQRCASAPEGAVPTGKSPFLGAAHFGVYRRNSFSTSAILTLQAPARPIGVGEASADTSHRNPYDLRLWRVRWPALLHNCSIRTDMAYGAGVRLIADSLPQALRDNHVTIRAEPGDLYLFNSEFLHMTPTIHGRKERIVLGAVAGYSSQSRRVEVWS